MDDEWMSRYVWAGGGVEKGGDRVADKWERRRGLSIHTSMGQ